MIFIVLTAPIFAAVLSMWSRSGITASLYGMVTFNPCKEGFAAMISGKSEISGNSKLRYEALIFSRANFSVKNR